MLPSVLTPVRRSLPSFLCKLNPMIIQGKEADSRISTDVAPPPTTGKTAATATQGSGCSDGPRAARPTKPHSVRPSPRATLPISRPRSIRPTSRRSRSLKRVARWRLLTKRGRRYPLAPTKLRLPAPKLCRQRTTILMAARPVVSRKV